MWVKFSCNEIMRNTKKNIIQMCICQRGMFSLGSKKQGIFIKTSGVVKIFFDRGDGNITLSKKAGYFH